MHRRGRRVVPASLCVLLLGISAAGCGEPEGKRFPDATDPRLAPRLLRDRAEIAKYIEAFPVEEYGISEVPEVGRFYVDDNAAWVKHALRRGQPWEPWVLKEVRRQIVPGTVVLDVGAHIGSITVPMARTVGPKGRVYAFEPQRKVYRELVHNIRLNQLSNAVPLRFALSAAPGVIEMDPTHRRDGQTQVRME